MDLPLNSEEANPSLLIIGAGISGLTLAQACRKNSIPYLLFERDSSPTARSAGWGLTLNWSLPTFRSLLPQDVLDKLPETYVNRAAVDGGEKGTFTFFDLHSGEARWCVPASGERIRVSRERLRRVLLTGLDVRWGKTLVEVGGSADGSVEVKFHDGSRASGNLLVGCDGANSQVRRLCHPDDYRNERLPVRFIGAGVRYPEAQIQAMYDLDPFFLQGSNPKTDVFLWFSFLDVPGDPHTITTDLTNGEATAGKEEEEEGMYRCQIMTSWPYRPGFLGRAESTEMPSSRDEQLAFMKTLADGFTEPFRSIVQSIPPESEVKEVHLADWQPRHTSTTPLGTQLGGKVVLLGDAAHAMVMYRGEGANHSIVDVAKLVDLLLTGDAVGREYEDEMIERTSLAVAASRRACLDAHEYQRLNEKSPLVRRRLLRADLEEVQR